MKGKKCIKFLTFFITLALCFVLFSNDTDAITYTENLVYDRSISASQFECGSRLSTASTLTVSSNSQCSLPSLTPSQVVSGTVRYVDYFKSLNTFDVSSDEFYQLTLFVTVTEPTSLPVSLMSSLSSSSSDDGNWQIMDVDIEYDSQTTQVNSVTQNGNFYLSEIFPDQTVLITFTMKPLRDGNYPIAISSPGNHLFTFNSGTGVQSAPGIKVRLVRRVYVYKQNPLKEMNEKDEEDRSNIESQSSDTDTEANEQGDEATQTGTSLFGAFTQLLGALTNVNGNTCTLPAMQVYTLNLGNMNLCQYDIPPQIMALVSIGMVFIIIPLGINLVKRMVSLYKEITG